MNILTIPEARALAFRLNEEAIAASDLWTYSFEVISAEHNRARVVTRDEDGNILGAL